jgi:hypothetical protein
LLRQFGDWGTGRLGDSFNVSRTSQLSGFFAPPFPSGGTNGQTLVSNEENAHFATGQFLEFFQDTFDADFSQSRPTFDGNGLTLSGVGGSSNVQTSTRAVISDQISYAFTRDITLFAMGGHEDINYSNQGGNGITFLTEPNGQLVPVATFGNTGQPSVNDLIWSLGATWTPNQDSSITVSYGHQNGFNSFSANGYYAATARTTLNMSYGSSLGTQLQNLQNQLNGSAASGNGTLVNGVTNGQQFGNINALPIADGVFRTDTLTIGSSTLLDRDILSINLLWTKQTTVGSVNSSSSESKTANVSWLHQLSPDVTLSAAVAYAIQTQTTGFTSIFNPGNNTSIAASVAAQWQLSDTLSASVRYSFFDRNSADAAFGLLENIIIVGISKHF